MNAQQIRKIRLETVKARYAVEFQARKTAYLAANAKPTANLAA